MNNVNRIISIKLPSMHRLAVIDLVYGFALHNIAPSRVWTEGSVLLLFVHVLDEESKIWHTLVPSWLRRGLLGLHPVLSLRRACLGVFIL